MATDYVHWRNLTDTSHLRAEMLRPNEKMVLTIEKVVQEEVIDNKGLKSLKPVAYFKEGVLPMVLNVTNCTTITNLYGTGNILEWPGKKIQIFATNTKVGGVPTPCLRIEKIVPKTNEVEYHCAVCGKQIDDKTYDLSVDKYGKAYCSKECLEKDKNGENLL